MGRDQVLGFAPGNWIEILDDDLELAGLPGELHRIDTIDFAGKTITLDSPRRCAEVPGRRNNAVSDRSGASHPHPPLGPVRQGLPRAMAPPWSRISARQAAPAIFPSPPPALAVILENGITVSFDLSAAGGSVQQPATTGPSLPAPTARWIS